MRKEKLFVYGTLKRGQPLHHLLKGARFWGEAEVRGFRLYDLGPYPALRPGNPQERVQGELYEIPASLLKTLDRVEDEYERVKTQVFTEKETVEAWVYLYREPLPAEKLLPQGRWPI